MSCVQKQKIQTKMVRGILDVVVLKVLKKQDLHGYSLIQKIKSFFGVRFGPSTIYPLLAKMQKKGLVSSVWSMSSSGMPKKVYSITDKGKALYGFSFTSFNVLWNQVRSEDLEMGVVVDAQKIRT